MQIIIEAKIFRTQYQGKDGFGCTVNVEATSNRPVPEANHFQKFTWYEERKTPEEALGCAIAFAMDRIKVPEGEVI